jgi:hypothetical protein
MKPNIKCGQQVYRVDQAGIAILGGRVEHPDIQVTISLTYACISWDDGRIQYIYSHDIQLWDEIGISCQLYEAL